jgi:hypothetical protein
MKKLFIAILVLSFSNSLLAQEVAKATKKKDKKVDLSNRPADHFMIQYGADGWMGKPDSIRTTGFSRHFNMYFMLDKPFKNSPHFSVGFGAGISSSNIFLKNTYLDIKSSSAKLPFRAVDSTDHFKKYKVTSIFLEAPIELRYYSDPEHVDKSWKAALGVKVGTLLNVHTKGKNLVNKNEQSLYGTNYVAKESNKRFFNGTRLALTGRVGYGNISFDYTYQITQLLKEGAGPELRPYSFGITISGL